MNHTPDVPGVSASPRAHGPRDAADTGYVLPGIETQMPPEPGIYVGLDWIRCTGPQSLLRPVESFLLDRFGPEPKGSHGARWFQRGLVWDPGILLSWQHRSSIVQVDIQGDRLRLLDGTERVELLRSLLLLGLNPTRLDGALDWVCQDVKLYTHAADSCKRGELCIFRRYGPNDEFTAQGYPTRRHLRLGSRESPVCARIYDKGLEQQVAPPGYWERLETEWKADRAPEVARQLCDASSFWSDRLASLILGSLDFREVNDRPELDRRPRSAWWAAIVKGRQTLRVAPSYPDMSISTWTAWFRGSVARRLLEFARSVGTSPEHVLSFLSSGVEPGRSGGPLVEQFRQAFLLAHPSFDRTCP